MAFVAPAFAAAGTAIASAGSFVSTAATVLQGVATVASVLSSVQQASAQQQAGQAAANEALLQSRIAVIEGQQEATASEARAVELRRETARKIGAARVAFGASGLDISSGQLASIESDINSDANFGLDIERLNERRALASSGLKAGQLELRASSAIAGANATAGATRIGAIGTAAKGLLSIVKRG